MKSPVVLIILDGWGIAPPNPSNAVELANTPHWDKLKKTYPFMLLDAGGQTVGLPWGAIGNSEVGHTIIGAGRIVYQDLPRINQSILDGSFFTNQAFLKAIHFAKQNNSKLHVVGLVSGAGGHSYDKHLYSLLELAKREGLRYVYIHAILDGRDSPYNSGLRFVEELVQETKNIGIGTIATLSGRYYAMDRDKHWERINKAYQAIVNGESEYYFQDPIEAIKSRYEKHNYDEEITPIVMVDKENNPIAKVLPHESIIVFNFRPDRVRQLTEAFVDENFKGFKRKYVDDLCFVTMTLYDVNLPVEVAFSPEAIKDSLAEVISKAKLFQLHVAETEKYAHITYFFNGGQETPWPGQDNTLVPSPRVSCYDQKPELSAKKVTAKVIQALKTAKYDFITVNFANADMVGHTGNLAATIQAVEILDSCMHKIILTALQCDGKVIVTADHGNAEQMQDEQGELDKEHSDNPVPFLLVGKDFKHGKCPETNECLGGLYDIAPTVLELLKLSKPNAMAGRSLLGFLDLSGVKKEKPIESFSFFKRLLNRKNTK